MLLAPFFDLDFCSPIGQLRPLIPALRMDYYLQYLSCLSTKSPTRGSGGQNTLICMKFSTWPLSSFLYVCSLERNAEEVYNSVYNINFQHKMEAKLNNNYWLNVKRQKRGIWFGVAGSSMSSLWKLQSGTKVQKFPFFNALFKSGKLPSKLVHKIIPCPLNGLCNYHDNYSQKMPDSAG